MQLHWTGCNQIPGSFLCLSEFQDRWWSFVERFDVHFFLTSHAVSHQFVSHCCSPLCRTAKVHSLDLCDIVSFSCFALCVAALCLASISNHRNMATQHRQSFCGPNYAQRALCWCTKLLQRLKRHPVSRLRVFNIGNRVEWTETLQWVILVKVL